MNARMGLLVCLLTLAAAGAEAQIEWPCDAAPQGAWTPASLEDELRQLRQRMGACEAELQALRQQVGPTTSPDAPNHPATWPPAAESPHAPPADETAGDGVTIEEAEIITRPTHRIGGRLFFDHIMYDNDPALGLDRENLTGFDTARMGMQGQAFENVSYQIEVEFEGTEVDFKTVYIELNRLPWLGNFRGGHFYEPISGLEETSGSRYRMFMERSLATTAFNPSRSYGFMDWNYREQPDLYWAVGTFRHESDDSPDKLGAILGDTGDWVLTTRAAWTPYYDELSEGRYLAHIGLGYSYRTDATQVEFDTVTELGDQAGFLATTVPGDRNYSLFVPEFLAIWGPFSVQSECYFVPAGPANFWGAYVEASYFLTGDHRGYRRDLKELTRPAVIEDFISLRTPFGLACGRGAWELKTRWSHVDLREGVGAKRGLQNNYLAGVNWYLNAYTRIMFDYVYEDVRQLTGVKGQTHGFGTRMHVEW